MNKHEKVRWLLESGAFSTVEISRKLHIADPRSSIRVLRAMGVPVQDYWLINSEVVRYKKYFIKYV